MFTLTRPHCMRALFKNLIMQTDTGTAFKKRKEVTPYMVDEYLLAVAVWETAPKTEIARKWQYACEIYNKHYQRTATGCIPISNEAKALAAQFPDAFKTEEA